MGQRVVLKATNGKVSLSELAAFLKVTRDYGIPLSEEADASMDSGELRISRELPSHVRVIGGKRVVLRQKTKKQQQVDDQIKEHKEEPAGEKKGYVPPVGRKTAPKVQKKKCPVCNVKKPLVKIAGVRVIKPHVSHGEPCEGGGQQA